MTTVFSNNNRNDNDQENTNINGMKKLSLDGILPLGTENETTTGLYSRKVISPESEQTGYERNCTNTKNYYENVGNSKTFLPMNFFLMVDEENINSNLLLEYGEQIGRMNEVKGGLMTTLDIKNQSDLVTWLKLLKNMAKQRYMDLVRREHIRFVNKHWNWKRASNSPLVCYKDLKVAFENLRNVQNSDLSRNWEIVYHLKYGMFQYQGHLDSNRFVVTLLSEYNAEYNYCKEFNCNFNRRLTSIVRGRGLYRTDRCYLGKTLKKCVSDTLVQGLTKNLINTTGMDLMIYAPRVNKTVIYTHKPNGKKIWFLIRVSSPAKSTTETFTVESTPLLTSCTHEEFMNEMKKGRLWHLLEKRLLKLLW